MVKNARAKQRKEVWVCREVKTVINGVIGAGLIWEGATWKTNWRSGGKTLGGFKQEWAWCVGETKSKEAGW